MQTFDEIFQKLFEKSFQFENSFKMFIFDSFMTSMLFAAIVYGWLF